MTNVHKLKESATSLPEVRLIRVCFHGLLEIETEAAMTFGLEEEFESTRWKLLTMVDSRKNLNDDSMIAIKADLEIANTRSLIRAYETLKGYWSRKPLSAFRQEPADIGPARVKMRNRGRQVSVDQ
jgi:hypothetical protein